MPFDLAESLPPVDWYLVPWGPAPTQANTLIVGLRVMPQADNLEGILALEDWPRFLDQLDSGHVAVKTQDGKVHPKRIELAARYRKQLELAGFSLDRASALWKGIFCDLITQIHARNAAATTSLPRRKDDPPRQEHCSAALARLCGERMAMVYADALNNSAKRAKRARAYAADGMEPVYGRVDHAAPTSTLQDQLHGAAALYASAKLPRRNLREQIRAIDAKIKDKLAQQDPLHAAADFKLDPWSQHGLMVMGAEPPKHATGVAALPADASPPYSSTHVEFLLTKATDPKATRHEASFGDEHDMDEFAVQLARRRRVYFSAGGSERGMEKKAPVVDTDVIKNFCTRAAALSLHPWLAKLLGLSLRFELTGTTVADIAAIAITSVVGDELPETGLKWTCVRGGFPCPVNQASDGRTEYDAGLLNVSDDGGAFLLTQLDVDRSPDRYVQAALTYNTEQQAGNHPSRIKVSLQPQETVGFSLIEVADRRKVVATAPPESAVLYLEHLLAGYRPDAGYVSEGNTTWRSLTARRIRRVLLDNNDVTSWFGNIGRSEAFLTEKTRTASTNEENATYLEGELFRWGTAGLGAAPQTTISENIGRAQDRTSRVGGLTIEYDPMDVPAQRFGRRYRFGVRLAMIDGDSLELNDAAHRYDGDRKTFTIGDAGTARYQGQACLRFEPIAPPTVLLKQAPDRKHFPQESTRRMVVASSAHHERNRSSTERVLVPPRSSSQDLCLRHGVFDRFKNGHGWPNSAFEDYKLTDGGDFPSRTAPAPSADHPDATSEEQYFEKRGLFDDRPMLPYYPDPWAYCAVIAIYRKGDDRLMYCDSFDYYQGRGWPDCKHMLVRLEAATEEIDRDQGFTPIMNREQGLTVRLARGIEVTVRVWHLATRTMLEQFAIVQQAAPLITADAVGKEFAADDTTAMRRAAVTRLLEWEATAKRNNATTVPGASFWMLNPYVELSLVHAVELPLQAITSDPDCPLEINRAAGQTSASFSGRLLLDRASTGRVRARGRWTDLPTRAGVDQHNRYTFTSNLKDVPLFEIPNIALVAGNDAGSPALQPQPLKLPEYQHYQRLDKELAVRHDDHSEPVRATADFDFGDTRARVIDVETQGDARLADEFADARQIEARRATLVPSVVVEGTARPEPPSVDYVVPVFAWDEYPTPINQTGRSREAGWFRIWLGPTWYKSGNGELLALVCWPGAALPPKPSPMRALLGVAPVDDATPPPAVEPLLTRWGLDPLTGQEIEFGNMPITALLNRLRGPSDLQRTGGRPDVLCIDMHHLEGMRDYEPIIDLHLLDEFRGLQLSDAEKKAYRGQLALYRPILDMASGRMFVDIQIDPAVAYQPFVRLGLARFQPLARHSVEENLDLRLSPILSTEFVQLLPHRAATLFNERDERGHTNKIRVKVIGTTIPNKGQAALATKFEATIEERQVNFVPDDAVNGAWVPVSSEAERQHLVFDAQDNGWVVSIPFRSRTSHEYSVRIEEYEQLGEKDAGERLVYFDRIPLRYL